MEAKTFEIRDAATFIPVLAIRLKPGNEVDRYLLSRAGYGKYGDSQKRYVVLWRLEGGHASYDEHSWGSARTMGAAHKHILHAWDRLESGAVIDVEHILGETDEPKLSERRTVPVLRRAAADARPSL